MADGHDDLVVCPCDQSPFYDELANAIWNLSENLNDVVLDMTSCGHLDRLSLFVQAISSAKGCISSCDMSPPYIPRARAGRACLDVIGVYDYGDRHHCAVCAFATCHRLRPYVGVVDAFDLSLPSRLVQQSSTAVVFALDRSSLLHTQPVLAA